MEKDYLNIDKIQNLLNELYDKAYEKGFNSSRVLEGDNCEADPREGVILSEGGKVEEDHTPQSTSAKSILVEYIKTKIIDTLNDTNN